jgi:phytoene dehydrogenase-like protein
MAHSVAIIGGGIAGLAAGCYLQMNGYQTQIFEAHTVPGGLCTGWKRRAHGTSDEYHFDGCMHWLLGSGPASPFYKMWSELVDMSAIEFVHHELKMDIALDQPDRFGDTVFHLYGNVPRLERYLKEIAPEDSDVIDELIASIRTLQKYLLPPLCDVAPEVRTWRDNLKLAGYLPFLLYARKWSKITNYQLAERVRNPFFREALRRWFIDMDLGIMLMTMQIAWYDQQCAGFPVGGSLPFAQRIAQRYESLGGTIHYHTPVCRILVENHRATGIELENGQQWAADTVISAADGHWTIFSALGGRYVDASIRDLYDGKTLDLYESMVLVSLGVARTFESEPHLFRFPLAEPLTLPDGTRFEWMEAHIYNYDPTLAPAGKTVVSVTLYTRNHSYWTELRERDHHAYRAVKDQVARDVIDRLDARLGAIAENVEAIDVSTPATVIRYTGNWLGSYEGWMVTDDPINVKPISKTLPGLDGFYMVGQWVEPGGGVPIAAQSGRNVAQIMCKRDGKRFQTTVVDRSAISPSLTPGQPDRQSVRRA